MALDVTRENTKEPAMYTHEGPRMFLTEDRTRAVPEGDPAARTLLVGTGGQLPTEEARRYGLLDAAEETKATKASQPQPNKAKAGPTNKAQE